MATRPTPPGTGTPQPYGCALCRRALDHDSTDGFHHAAAAPQHPPIPVPLDQISDPVLVCDHCNAPQPAYRYRAAPLEAVLLGVTDARRHHIGEDFATCTGCAARIEARDRSGLLERSLRGLQRVTGEPADATTVASLRMLQDAFWATLRPGRQLLPPGDPRPAAPIRAAILPKVRDRLAAWWNSADPHDSTELAARDGAWYIPAHLARGAHDEATAPVPAGRVLAARFAGRLAESLARARLLWIDPAFSELARHAAADLPALPIDPDQVPGDDGLILWGSPIPGETCAASWTRIPGGWWVCFYAAIGAGLHEPALQTLRTRIGWLHPVSIGVPLAQDGTAGSAHREQLSVLVATWALATQPLAVTSTEPVESAIRRAYSRAGRAAPEIHLVRLRFRASGSDAGGASGRRYDHQWWVNGFWRQQPYGPRNSLRRPVYIAGHLAGPADAPVRIRPTVHVLGSARTPLTP